MLWAIWIRIFSEDVSAIQWLKENIKGAPVVLEANGDSYSGYERVSAATGLPTILGWYVHEWLWRNDTDDLNRKQADIMSIYTSQDETQVRALLTEYMVFPISLWALKKERNMRTALNNALLLSLEKLYLWMKIPALILLRWIDKAFKQVLY